MINLYKYPRPAVAVDIIVLRGQYPDQQILLIARKNNPYRGMWALPGGFINMNEDLHESASRELEEETGLKEINLIQFRTYGKPGRDPRGRTVSVVHYALLDEKDTPRIAAGDDASKAAWFPIATLPRLGFDHELILKDFIALLNSPGFRR
jgi:8-oxo-dGTP diphosphatase